MCVCVCVCVRADTQCVLLIEVKTPHNGLLVQGILGFNTKTGRMFGENFS